MSGFTALDYKRLSESVIDYSIVDKAILAGKKQAHIPINESDVGIPYVTRINEYLMKYDYVYDQTTKERIIATVKDVGGSNGIKYVIIEFSTKKINTPRDAH
jgi:hypothetical protein